MSLGPQITRLSLACEVFRSKANGTSAHDEQEAAVELADAAERLIAAWRANRQPGGQVDRSI